MKIKEGFLLRKVAGNIIVVPTGNKVMDFNVMISLNETGAFLWELLNNELTELQLVEKIIEEFKVSKKIAQKDVKTFVKRLEKEGLLE